MGSFLWWNPYPLCYEIKIQWANQDFTWDSQCLQVSPAGKSLFLQAPSGFPEDGEISQRTSNFPDVSPQDWVERSTSSLKKTRWILMSLVFVKRWRLNEAVLISEKCGVWHFRVADSGKMQMSCCLLLDGWGLVFCLGMSHPRMDEGFLKHRKGLRKAEGISSKHWFFTNTPAFLNPFLCFMSVLGTKYAPKSQILADLFPTFTVFYRGFTVS